MATDAEVRDIMARLNDPMRGIDRLGVSAADMQKVGKWAENLVGREAVLAAEIKGSEELLIQWRAILEAARRRRTGKHESSDERTWKREVKEEEQRLKSLSSELRSLQRKKKRKEGGCLVM